MKIEGWHAEGFGVFQDYAVESVTPGLNVFLGPNEAGKSTLLRFLRSMLFGVKGQERRLEPLRGGRFGGRIFLSSATGERYVVERAFARRAAPSIRRADGTEAPEAVLTHLLGGCDKTLFEAVFAFDLSQLQSLKALSEAGVRDRIFSTGIVGAGVDAREAMLSLEKRRTDLLRPRSDQGRINSLLKELGAIRRRIQAAREIVTGYEAVRLLEAQNAANVDSLRGTIAATRSEQARLERLIFLWPSWNERSEALAALKPLDKTAHIGLSDDLVATIDTLSADLVLHREHLNRLPDLADRCQLAVAALDDKLRDLGPQWDRTTLIAFDRSIATSDQVRTHDELLSATAAALLRAEVDLKYAQGQLADAERERDERQDELSANPVPPSLDVIDEKNRVITRLRSGLTGLEAARSRSELATRELDQIGWQEREAAANSPWVSPAWLAPGLLALTFTAAALAVWRGLDDRVVGAIGVAIAIVFAVATIIARLHRARRLAADSVQRAHTAARLTDAQTVLERERTEVRRLEDQSAADCAILGLAFPPTGEDLDALASQTSRDLLARQIYEAKERECTHAARQVQNRLSQVEDAQGAVETKRAERDEALSAWQDWKQKTGVPANLAAPSSVLDFFNAVNAGRELLRHARAAEREHAEMTGAIAAYEDRVRAVLAAISSNTPTDRQSTLLTVETLQNRVQREHATKARREELKRTIGQAEARISEQIGRGEHAAGVVRELAAGDIESWRAGAAEKTALLEELENQLAEAVREHRDTETSRLAIETSADVARLELDEAALAEELRVAVRDWQILDVARRLIEETLAQYQRDRQPGVLADASRLFAKATAGRYTQVAQHENDLRIIDQTETWRSVDALSRGTAEQLYLCIRLGLAAEFARRTTSLPLVMDDILVNFDPERARAIAELLVEFAAEHQILLFTCHPATAHLFRELSDTCQCYAMRRYGEGGDWLTATLDQPPTHRLPALDKNATI